MNPEYEFGEETGRKRIKSDEDFAAEKAAQDKAREELDVQASCVSVQLHLTDPPSA
jgi:hypothetical protein